MFAENVRKFFGCFSDKKYSHLWDMRYEMKGNVM